MAKSPRASTSLREAFQGLVQRETTLLQGTVTSKSPLKIQIVNDAKLELSDGALCVPARLKNDLSKGNTVYVLSLDNGKKYYVLDKG